MGERPPAAEVLTALLLRHGGIWPTLDRQQTERAVESILAEMPDAGYAMVPNPPWHVEMELMEARTQRNHAVRALATIVECGRENECAYHFGAEFHAVVRIAEDVMRQDWARQIVDE